MLSLAVDALLIFFSQLPFILMSSSAWFWVIPVLQAGFLYACRAYRTPWRFLHVSDLARIAVAAAFSFLWLLPPANISFSEASFLYTGQLLLLLIHRLFWNFRLNPERRLKKTGEVPIVLYGAGSVTMHLLRELLENDTEGRYQIEAVLDNDPGKLGQRIGPYTIQSGNELEGIIQSRNVKEVWFTMPPEPDFFEQIIDTLKPYSLLYKIVPRKFAEVIRDIRALRIEDLIQRPEVRLPPEPLENLIKGKRILVTGAAGSIGNEIARQVAKYQPKRLVLIDQYEHGVYRLQQEWGDDDSCISYVADVRDPFRLSAILNEEKPEIIFHAAAYKHVPLMEKNFTEAVRTNILGTWQLLRIIRRHMKDSRRAHIQFVNISTDKAVQPESVMGITKRIAELIVYNMAMQTENQRLKTVSVRFGNVLGSSGSVVPLFWKQLNEGGPLTVTHPEMERFFMSIPEAVNLVLHALVQARENDILALDMGEPVKIKDLAERIITLAGYKPHEEIQITYTGIRPGEKLKEELFWAECEETENPYIYRSSKDLKEMNTDEFLSQLTEALSEPHSVQWWKGFLLNWI